MGGRGNYIIFFSVQDPLEFSDEVSAICLAEQDIQNRYNLTSFT